MNRRSVEDSIVIEPPLTGRFQWSEDSRSLALVRAASFDSNAVHLCRIRSEAQDHTGGNLDGNYDQIRDGGPADDFVRTFSFPMANDDFGSAWAITVPAGTILGNNRHSSVEFDESSPLVGTFEQFGMPVW